MKQFEHFFFFNKETIFIISYSGIQVNFNKWKVESTFIKVSKYFTLSRLSGLIIYIFIIIFNLARNNATIYSMVDVSEL